MLTDQQLHHLGDAMDFKIESICFKDELPKVLKYNTAYIINLENSLDEEGNPNEGSHWTCLQVNKYPSGLVEPIYFDPYGQPPAESIKKFVKDNIHRELPFTDKDIQSLMNNACGWYCCAFLHYINKWEHRTKNLYLDVEHFLEFFDDLDTSADFKKNEYILKHFFRAKDESKRKAVEVFADSDTISSENDMGVRIPAELKYA
jgi:hypothetical protein